MSQEKPGIEEFGPSYLQSKKTLPDGLKAAIDGTVEEAPNLAAAIGAADRDLPPDVAGALREGQAAERDAEQQHRTSTTPPSSATTGRGRTGCPTWQCTHTPQG